MLNDIEITTPLDTARRLRRAMKQGLKLWEDALFVTAEVPLDPIATQKILPWGLWPTRPARATLFVADYPKTAFTVPYREAALLVHVRTPFGEGVHCAWIVVDDDTALVYGRELLGYPKKMASIQWEEEEEKVRAAVQRRGVRLLEVEATRVRRDHAPAPVLGRKTFNVGGPGQLWLWNPIWLSRPKEVVLDAHEASVALHVEPSAADPLAELVAGPPESGRTAVADILGSHYSFIVGLAGPGTFLSTFRLRFR